MRIPADTKIEDMPVGGHRRPHLVTAMPTLGMVPVENVLAIMRMQLPINGITSFMPIKGMEVGAARNYAAEQVLKMDPRPKYLFFLGDDMIPPWDGAMRLYEEAERGQWDVLTGLYFWKGEPPTSLVFRKDHVGRMIPNVHYKVGDVVWVDLTGLDFTLIRVSIFDRITPPYFKTGPTHNLAGMVIQHTEDVWFMDKVKAAKGRMGVHTGIRVGHLEASTGMVF